MRLICYMGNIEWLNLKPDCEEEGLKKWYT